MTRTEIQAKVIDALVSVAPEIPPASLKLDSPLRDQVDLDSMDFLRFLMELHKQLRIEIPEADYARLGSLTDVVNYVANALEVPAP
jgi:acyl carrier protein